MTLIDYETIIICQARYKYKKEKTLSWPVMTEISLLERYGKTVSNEEKERLLSKLLQYICDYNNLKVCEWIAYTLPTYSSININK